MLPDVQAYFGRAKPFQRVGNFETEHQRALMREVYSVVQTGRLVVVAGLVGSGKPSASAKSASPPRWLSKCCRGQSTTLSRR